MIAEEKMGNNVLENIDSGVLGDGRFRLRVWTRGPLRVLTPDAPAATPTGRGVANRVFSGWRRLRRISNKSSIRASERQRWCSQAFINPVSSAFRSRQQVRYRQFLESRAKLKSERGRGLPNVKHPSSARGTTNPTCWKDLVDPDRLGCQRPSCKGQPCSRRTRSASCPFLAMRPPRGAGRPNAW